jgi:hypothetical protein
MQAKWKKVIESLQRVQVFLGAHPAPGSASYAEPKEVLADVLRIVGDHSTEQVSGLRLSQAEKRRQDVLMRQLRERHLRPIAAIARANRAEMPGIDRALRLPHASLGPIGLVSAAKSIRRSVGLYQPVFVRNGRPADFLEQLDSAIMSLDESAAGRGRLVARHVGARAGIKKELRRGRRAVDMLDTIVRVAFEGQDDVLAEWDVAKRVQSLPTSSVSVAEEDPVIVPDAKLSAA